MSTSAHHVDHPVCIEGIAAYWFERSATAPLSNDHSPPNSASVSTTPYPWQSTTCCSWHAPYFDVSPSSRGGMSENEANPISASPVIAASVLRHAEYRSGWRTNMSASAATVTTKCAVP